MLVERASYSWAYSEDIRGSRCGPEDGPWPRPYQVLSEAELWRELRILAKPQSTVFDAKKGWRADSINFQPSPKTKTQDRYIVTQLDIHGRTWTLTGVFDGHLGDVTVEHVAFHLPIIIRDFLREALANDPSCEFTPDLIADLFSRSIIAFDDAIANDVLDLFGGIEGLDNFSDAEIRDIINDQYSGGANWKKARLCMYGTTALVALVDPDHSNLWVANLGDCQAVMASSGDSEGDWNIERLTTDHNGDNDAEVERVRQAHPGEPECVLDRRVLGALAPFRCLGDIPFKQPPAFTRRILYNLFPGFHNTSPWEEFLVRNLTPPYITAQPEITHRRLDDPLLRGPRFLILASDGLTDLCSGEGQKRIISSWATSMITPAYEPSMIGCAGRGGTVEKPDNMALRLLRRALGGEDRYSVSRILTLDMDVAWIDDTSIVVQTL
ncbi:phosphatase 2C-like domain-containing protein [Collybia nuda]|uniref:Phosphatase 2C-like domain-containing protein n=1 Tax=Collybia nuda TaxID=64659 RepID=A0A9P5YBC6_9AGAR|nr:phosphatase 2C-like domain-containing protein [Collybia nuda]